MEHIHIEMDLPWWATIVVSKIKAYSYLAHHSLTTIFSHGIVAFAIVPDRSEGTEEHGGHEQHHAGDAEAPSQGFKGQNL